MPAVWITPDFVNGPKKQGGKFGSIKTREAGYISVPVGDLHQFQKGQQVCIEIEEVGQYKNFVRFAEQAPGMQHSNSGYQPQVAANYRQPPPPQNFRSAPQPIARSLPSRPTQRPQPPMASPSPVNDDQARNIFITGIVGRALGSGKFSGFDILELTREAAQAYDVVFRGMQLEQRDARDILDDPVPDLTQYAPPHDQGAGQDIPY